MEWIGEEVEVEAGEVSMIGEEVEEIFMEEDEAEEISLIEEEAVGEAIGVEEEEDTIMT